MGSKRSMLTNGLGSLILSEGAHSNRLIDLFSGSGAVSWFMAEKTDKPVFSIDIQYFSKALALSILSRTTPIDHKAIADKWLGKTIDLYYDHPFLKEAEQIVKKARNVVELVSLSRQICSSMLNHEWVIWSAYGGYYFSPTQSILLDAMRSSIPKRGVNHWICLAAIIITASKCAASPGHTAQPFSPTATAGPFILEAWGKDPLTIARQSLLEICNRYSQVKGDAKVGDAIKFAKQLNERDLVFVDPPYSGVHYSRFYHVLETVARGRCGTVSGAGRYPPLDERPSSQFSQKSKAKSALKNLLANLAYSGCSVIFTFPQQESSNGLSGQLVVDAATDCFRIAKQVVNSKFSTLGGNNHHRSARKDTKEMILLLKPK